MKKLLSLLLLFPLFSLAQGIKFEEELTWKQVLAKARAENKYIFIDAFATWCGPCKTMEIKTFSNDTIGEYINKNFIPVRLQFDTTVNDNEKVKVWHSLSREFSKDFKITSYPTYLFFDQNGNILHKAIGFKKISDFLSVIKDAINPEKQFYVRLKKMRENTLSREEYQMLTESAQILGEGDLAAETVRSFLERYVNRNHTSTELTKEEWKFILRNAKVLRSTDMAFEWCLHNSDQIDSLVETKVAKRIADAVIYSEEVTSKVETSKILMQTPDWKKIEKTIGQKYGMEYVNNKLIAAKTGWYHYKKDWPLYTKFLVKLVESADIDKMPATGGTAFYLNNNAWEVFLRGDPKKNKTQLKEALNWMNLLKKLSEHGESIMRNPRFNVTHFDTEANLLYKLGRIKEAVSLEEKAIKICLDHKMTEQGKEFRDNLEKMKKRLPTWLDEE